MRPFRGVFKLNEQVDYTNLPAQTNQAVLKLINQDWKSFLMLQKNIKLIQVNSKESLKCQAMLRKMA